MNMTDKEFEMLLEEIGAEGFVEPLANLSIESKEEVKAPVSVPAKKSKSAITDNELDNIFSDLQSTFGEKEFKNRDLTNLLDKWGLTARQTPSRLKKLVDAGLLQDLGGSPKSYQIK